MVKWHRYGTVECNREKCCNWQNGGCVVLSDNYFKHGGCPFYKTADQSYAESVRGYRRLLEFRRFDLIEKYKDYYKAVGLYDPDEIDRLENPELYEMFGEMNEYEKSLRNAEKMDTSADDDAWE